MWKHTHVQTKCDHCSMLFPNSGNLGRHKKERIRTRCSYCDQPLCKDRKHLRNSKSGRMYCSQSCSALHRHKMGWCDAKVRSKPEIMLFEALVERFPNLTIIPNDKVVLDGLEMDIYVKEAKLCVEWNGRYHYEPIYGDEKFLKRQENDIKKSLLCREKGIRMLVIADFTHEGPKRRALVADALEQVSEVIRDLVPPLGF